MSDAEPTPISVEGGDERAFVFRYLSDLTALGVFVPQPHPLPIGEPVRVAVGPLSLPGVVAWRNPESSETPGVGVRLSDVEEEDVDTLIGEVRAIAYLADDPDA